MTVTDLAANLAQLLAETPISFNSLAQERDVSIPTVWRWTQRGIKSHVLESFSQGGRKFTTREAFARWIARINGEKAVGAITPRQREREIDRAEKKAAELGVPVIDESAFREKIGE